MAARGLYKATDGSWRQADADKGIPLLYRLKEGERWTLLHRDRAMVVHPGTAVKNRLPGRPRGGDPFKHRSLAGL